jgi:hypothetical protein
LLQKSDLTTRGSDGRLVVLAHLFVDERGNNFPGRHDAGQIHVKVVEIEEDDATAIERYRALQIDGGRATRGGELGFLVATRDDLFECFDRADLAVDA